MNALVKIAVRHLLWRCQGVCHHRQQFWNVSELFQGTKQPEVHLCSIRHRDERRRADEGGRLTVSNMALWVIRNRPSSSGTNWIKYGRVHWHFGAVNSVWNELPLPSTTTPQLSLIRKPTSASNLQPLPPTSATNLRLRPQLPTSNDLRYRPPPPISATYLHRPPPTSATDLRCRPPPTSAADLRYRPALPTSATNLHRPPLPTSAADFRYRPPLPTSATDLRYWPPLPTSADFHQCTNIWFRCECNNMWFRCECTNIWLRYECTNIWFS